MGAVNLTSLGTVFTIFSRSFEQVLRKAPFEAASLFISPLPSIEKIRSSERAETL